MIRVLESDHPGGLAEFLLKYVGNLPTATAAIDVPAEVNHGQWIVKCPFCFSAQQASETDPRWFCTDCKNAKAGGKWLTVTWPKNRSQLEEVLTDRPETATRNWLPTETLQDLRQENHRRGV